MALLCEWYRLSTTRMQKQDHRGIEEEAYWGKMQGTKKNLIKYTVPYHPSLPCTSPLSEAVCVNNNRNKTLLK